MRVRLPFSYVLRNGRLVAQLTRIILWQIHTIGVVERMFRLILSGMVINAGGRLIARATFML